MPDRDDGDTRYVLSIDGGGIRGILAARVLAALEKRVPWPLHRCFDLIAGTSTGGIVAAGLAIPGAGGVPKKAADIERFYEEKGSAIFPQSWFGSAVALLRGPLYSPEALETMLKAELGADTMMSAAVTGLLVTAYDTEQRRAVFLSNVDDHEIDVRAWQAVRATSAAPTYFPPMLIETPGRTPDHLSLVDGGVFATDPALAAYVDVQKIEPERRPPGRTVVVSVGTGYDDACYPYETVRKWGRLDWIAPSNGTPIVSILMQGQAGTASYQLNTILNGRKARFANGAFTLGDGARWADLDYYRFDGRLEHASPHLDNASATNLEALQVDADAIITAMGPALDAVAAKLEPRVRP